MRFDWIRVAVPVLLLIAVAGIAPPSFGIQAIPRAQPYAIRDVRLAAAADSPRRTLVLRHGLIESVLDVGADVPVDARIIEGKGMLALPAFVDAYTQTGCETPTPVADRDAPPSASTEALVDMREANRKGLQPAFRAAEAFQLDADVRKRLRASGFGLVLSAPAGQFLSGQSTLASTRDVPARDALLVPVEFDHAGFQAGGSGYPGTLMGAIAQLRQFFFDAQRTGTIVARRAAGKGGPRPPYDADLEAIGPALSKRRLVVCEADSAGDIDRWIALSEEFGLEIAISGGREAWRRAPRLRERGIPVFLTLDWGEEVEDPHAKDKKKTSEGGQGKSGERGDPESAAEEPTPTAESEPQVTAKPEEQPKEGQAAKEPDWTYQKPLRVREEERRLWEETRDNAIRLAEAGVPFALATGRGSVKDLLERVRTLVEKGLPVDEALAALTTRSASLLGVGDEYGKLEPGFAASIALWTKDPITAKDAKVAWLVSEGFPYELEVDTKALEGKPDEGVDASGAWLIEYETPPGRSATAELEMKPSGDVRGTVRYKNPNDENERSGDFEGHVAGKKIRLTGQVKFGNFEAEVVLEGEIEKDEMTGTTTWKFSRREDVRRFKATRTPKQEGEFR